MSTRFFASAKICLCVVCSLGLLILASCVQQKIPSSVPTALTLTPTTATPSLVISSSAPVPSFTPSMIPIHSLEQLKDKWPSVTPAYGFVVLEMPKTVSWDDMITVTILTVPGSDCLIQYFGTSGLSHAAGLEPQIADANGICSWTWKQATILGKNAGALPLTAKISIVADGFWSDYQIVVK